MELGTAPTDRDGERAGCPPGIQRGDIELCLSDGHPALFDSSGMESVVRNVVVAVSVPHAPSVPEFTPAQDIPRLQTIPDSKIQLHSRVGFTRVTLWNFPDKPREDKCGGLDVTMVTLKSQPMGSLG